MNRNRFKNKRRTFKLKFKKRTFMPLALVILALLPNATHAQTRELEYVPATMENLAKMYWRLNKFVEDDPIAIDNFMRITECDVYKDYYNNEFEWLNVRDSGQNYIKEHTESFPLRFEFVQPLSLGEYNFETSAFDVIDEHKMDGIKRFEIAAIDGHSDICGSRRPIAGYPKSILLELSRPLDVTSVAVPKEKARTLIEKKMREFNELNEKNQTKSNLYSLRDTVLVMKVKLFSYKAPDTLDAGGNPQANTLAILEGMEIYETQDRRNLIYSESYLRKRVKSEFEESLKKRYQAKQGAEESSEAE